MTSNNKTPPVMGPDTDYDRWKNELSVWKLVTDLDKKKQALAVTLSLSGKARQTALDIPVEELNEDEGMTVLISALDKIFLKDSVDRTYEAYSKFDSYKRTDQMSMNDYIVEYEQLYNQCKKYKMTLPDSVLSFKLLDNSNLNQQERQLALTAAHDLQFDTMKAALRRIFGNKTSNNTAAMSGLSIKQETAYYTEQKRRGYQSNFRNKFSGKGPKGTNPLDRFGRRSKCAICSSVFHWARDCPHKQEVSNVKFTEDNEEIPEECYLTLFTKSKKSENEIFLTESMGCAIIDTACTRTVCGKTWFEDFVNSLEEQDKDSIEERESNRKFRFGDGAQVTSIKNVIIPAQIGEKTCTISTEVVEADIPLLLSKETLKKARTVLDLNKDKAVMFDKQVPLEFTSSGHYCIDITCTKNRQQSEEALCIDETSTPADKKKSLLKLHKQFGHASTERLTKLLNNAGNRDKETMNLLSEVIQKCEICVKNKRPPPRPAVGLPLATDFNEVVAVDLHEIEKSKLWYLHIIDEFTRFSSGAIITSKRPTVFVRCFIKNWIGIHGAPRKLYSDNGGEFSNDEVRDMCQNFNIEIKTTAAYSPWSNGLLERHNYTLTEILRKVKSDQNCDWDVALHWALMAKNSLANNHGYSPYQLVFGRNPKLPSILCDKAPALEAKTYSSTVADHINTLHAARKAFVEAESSERLRRAIRKNTRHLPEKYVTGEKVYYKRPDQPEWKGPGVVIGHDGAIVFIRHGGLVVRVHHCRVGKVQSVDDGFTTKLDDDIIREKKNPSDKSTANNYEDDMDDSSQDEQPDTQEDRPQGNRNSITNVNKLKAGDLIKYNHLETDEEMSARILGRAGKATGKNKTWFNIEFITPDPLIGIKQSVDLNTVKGLSMIEHPDEQATEDVMVVNEVSMEDAKQEELKSWLNNKVYIEVEDEGQTCISTRWVCTLKTTENGIKHKARLVARGFEEDTSDIAKNSPTCAKESLRLILAVMAQNRFQINSMDIKTAFLQGERIQRQVYIRPPKEAQCDKTKLWQLEKCIYGLSDASLHWYKRVKDVMIKTGGRVSKFDQAVFLWHNQEGSLIGILACHVDDFIWGGTVDFRKSVIEQIRSEFKVGKEDSDAFRYVGMKLAQGKNNAIILQQNDYTNNIVSLDLPKERLLNKDALLSEKEKRQLRGKIGQLLWVAKQSRPDILFDTCILASSLKDAKVKDILLANKLVSRVKSNNVSLMFQDLGECTPTLVIFSDASFANLPSGGSQGGYFIILMSGNGKFSPIAWNSKKIQRVARSTLAAETLAMTNAIDSGIVLANLYREIMRGELSVVCITDSKSLYEATRSNKSVLEKRLRVEINSIREVLDNRTIKQLRWSAASRQLADCLTKHGASHLSMMKALDEGQIDIEDILM